VRADVFVCFSLGGREGACADGTLNSNVYSGLPPSVSMSEWRGAIQTYRPTMDCV